MRPRCCLRYFTFFGINISKLSGLWLLTQSLERTHSLLRLALLGGQNFALINPDLHPDYPVGGPCFRKTVIDIGAQSVQRQAPLQIPFRAGSFVPIQTAAHPDLDALAT